MWSEGDEAEDARWRSLRGKYAAPQKAERSEALCQHRRFSPDGEGRAERGVQKVCAGEAAGTQKRSLAEAGGEEAAEDGGYQNGQRRTLRGGLSVWLLQKMQRPRVKGARRVAR